MITNRKLNSLYLVSAGLILFLILFSSSVSATTITANITDLGTLGGSSSFAFGINNNGQWS